jgi:hypothetical protein
MPAPTYASVGRFGKRRASVRRGLAGVVGAPRRKDTLDVHLHPAGASRQFANDAKGFSALIAWLEDFAIARVAFEPTGVYRRAFERRLAEAGLPLVKVNPRQARRFAEATGRHAKTDAVDAARRPLGTRRGLANGKIALGVPSQTSARQTASRFLNGRFLPSRIPMRRCADWPYGLKARPILEGIEP